MGTGADLDSVPLCHCATDGNWTPIRRSSGPCPNFVTDWTMTALTQQKTTTNQYLQFCETKLKDLSEIFTLWGDPDGDYFDFKFIRFRIYSGSIRTEVKFRPSFLWDQNFCELLWIRGWYMWILARHSSRAVQGMNCLRSLGRCDWGFESRSRHGCLVCMRLFCVCVFLCLRRPCDWLITRPRRTSICEKMITELNKRPRPWMDWKSPWKKSMQIFTGITMILSKQIRQLDLTVGGVTFRER
jgi:hypothetical protein